MSAVGLDIGSDGLVVAVIRNRAVEVLQNEVGKRLTPNIVAFSGKQRLLGDQAIAQYGSNPKNSIKYVRRLLGRKLEDPELKEERKHLTYKLGKGKDGGVLIEVNYDDQQQQFTPEQVTAALLQRAKSIAEKGLSSKVSDVVIGIPSFWTDRERRALLDAASIAGLNVLRLMHESTAVGLQYGILRPLPDKETRYVLFIDMGLASYYVSLISFTGGKQLNVLACESDRNFGGRNVDQMLADHFGKYIKSKYKLDVQSDFKANIKLLKECDRVKTVLSANSVSEFHVEYIMNDTDVKGRIERTEFEALFVANFRETLIAPIQRVFESAAAKEHKLTKENIHSVEIVGGAVRMPIFQKTLKDYLGKELMKTCDGDESIARGCALQCAMLSPSFKVKDFQVHDVYSYPIDLAWGPAPASGSDAMEVEIQKSTTLFQKDNPIPSIKSVAFPDRTEPFQLVARYTETRPSFLPPGTDPLLGRWIVGVPKPADPTKPIPKIKVFVKLDVHGAVRVSSAQLLEEYIVEEPIEEPKPAAANATTKESEKKDPKPADKSEGDKEKKEGAEKDKSTPMEEDTAPEKDKEKPKTKKKKKIRKTDLKIETVVSGGLPSDLLKAFTEKEAQMANQDRVVEETAEARNALESYILEMRNKVQDQKDLAHYISDKDREKFIDALTKAEEWLNDEGYDAQKSEYTSRLDTLKKTGDPVQNRKREESGRPDRISALKSAIGKYSNFSTSKDEKYAHIEETEKKKVAKLATDIDQWLAQTLSKQDRIAKHDDPVLTTKALMDKLQELETVGEPIITKPKPKPKEEPKKEESKPDDAKKDQDKKGDEKAKASTEKDKDKDKEQQATKKAKTDSGKDKDGSKSPTGNGQAKMDTS